MVARCRRSHEGSYQRPCAEPSARHAQNQRCFTTSTKKIASTKKKPTCVMQVGFPLAGIGGGREKPAIGIVRPLKRIVHGKFYRVRCCLVADDLFAFQFDIGVNLIVGEDVAFLQEGTVGIEGVERFVQGRTHRWDIL